MDWMSGVHSSTEAEDFSSSLCIQIGSETNPATCTKCIEGTLPQGVKCGCGVMLTTHPILVLRLRKSRSYTLSPLKHLYGM
jgi:hypothetical protein